MSSDGRGCVVVGAGLAAATVAQTLREGGFDHPVTLIGDERERPYERPALSKDYLQGKTDAADLYVHSSDWYADHQVRTHFGETVLGIDRGRCEVRLQSGQAAAYDHLVLATGASPRRLSLPGVDLAGVHTLRRIEDADILRAALAEAERWVIIGAGWIGLEVAAAARLAGCEVSILESGPIPLRRVLGDELGRYFAALHRSNGVDLRTGATVSAIMGDGGQVTAVATDGGSLPADVVLVAVGVIPNTGLAASAGLEIDNGIVVDEQLRSSDRHILAAGDVANAYHPIHGRLRVEHWDNAIRQGQLAANTILGKADRYDWQPYFYTDQYDLGMEYVGHAQPDDEVIVRGDIHSGAFIVFWTRDGTVTAAMNVNVWDVIDQLRELVGRAISTARLRDTAIPLNDL
ncbi:MAG: ferredoxin reductase [Propionibacteriaceae bacterium]|nr:ferredoxin reductase [Propionibacteriaceae bacterium]